MKTKHLMWTRIPEWLTLSHLKQSNLNVKLVVYYNLGQKSWHANVWLLRLSIHILKTDCYVKLFIQYS